MGRNGRRRMGHDGAGGEVVRRAGSVSWPVRFNLRLCRLWRGSVPEKMSRIFAVRLFHVRKRNPQPELVVTIVEYQVVTSLRHQLHMLFAAFYLTDGSICLKARSQSDCTMSGCRQSM